MAGEGALLGFGVAIHPTGRRVFVVRYLTKDGLDRRMVLGKVGILTVDEARREARKILVEARNAAPGHADATRLLEEIDEDEAEASRAP